LADRRGWKLAGSLPGGGVALTIDGSATAYVLTGAPAAQPTELSVPDPSVGRPHARLLIAVGRLGLEDLGTAGGTFIDGARLLPEHGPRDISAARSIRLGTVELALSRA
jgi:pSer/pThr/pTyr-binding forkhead associated (FHA) protein